MLRLITIIYYETTHSTMANTEQNQRIRLRDGQTRVIVKYTSFLEGRSLPDRLEWIIMDYQRMKTQREDQREDKEWGYEDLNPIVRELVV